jgi:hypothetical protein
VAAGETFEAAMVREACEELFDEPVTPRVRLASSGAEYRGLLDEGLTRRGIVVRRVGLRLNLRDVRHRPGGGFRNVVYHVAIFRGRTDLAESAFKPQASEIDDLRYFDPHAVDRFLLEGRLAPNMAFLWLTEAHALLGDAVPPPD